MTDRKYRTNDDDDAEKRSFEDAAKESTGASEASYIGVDDHTLKTYVEADGEEVVMDYGVDGQPYVIPDEDW